MGRRTRNIEDIGTEEVGGDHLSIFDLLPVTPQRRKDTKGFLGKLRNQVVVVFELV